MSAQWCSLKRWAISLIGLTRSDGVRVMRRVEIVRLKLQKGLAVADLGIGRPPKKTAHVWQAISSLLNSVLYCHCVGVNGFLAGHAF